MAVKTNQPVEISTDVCFPERQIMHIRSHGQHCMRGAFRMSSGIPPTTLKTVRQYNPALSARQRSNQLTPELRPSASDGAHTHSSRTHFRSHGQRCMRGAFRVVSGIAPTASETARPHQPALSARQRSACRHSGLHQFAPRHTDVAPISAHAGSVAYFSFFRCSERVTDIFWCSAMISPAAPCSSAKLAACFPAAGAFTGGRSQSCHQRPDTRRRMLGAHREASNV